MEIIEYMFKKGAKDFSNIPLHYPKYTKAMYEEMPETELDLLLKSYSLPTTGDLQYKRKAAIDHFIWSSCEKPDPHSLFDKMPLNYPRYTKKDYEEMKEWKLDLLLGTYGVVPVPRSLEEKREMAMGHFLWGGAKDGGDGEIEGCKKDWGFERFVSWFRWSLSRLNGECVN